MAQKRNSRKSAPIWKTIETVGLQRSRSSSQFWTRLGKTFPALAAEFGEKVAARKGGCNEDPYSVKNADLAFANAVGSQYDSDRLHAFLQWFKNAIASLDGANLLDVGCDNGALTCTLALMYPRGTFVGVDHNQEAINLANERAQMLKLENVTFHCRSAGSLVDEFGDGAFNVVLTALVMHELLACNPAKPDDLACGSFDPNTFSYTAAWESVQLDTEAIDHIRDVRRLLEPAGIYISLDRWAKFEQYALWVQALEACDFQISLDASYVLEYTDKVSDRKENMPITVAAPGLKYQLGRDEAFSVFAYNRFASAGGVATYEHVAADAMMQSLGARGFLEAECVFTNGTGTFRLNQGIAGPLTYIFETSSQGYRRLRLGPLVAVRELFDTLVSEVLAYIPHADISIKADDSILCRYELNLGHLADSRQ